MFEQSTATVKKLVGLLFLLAASAGVAAGGNGSLPADDSISIEGTWITVAATPLGNINFTQTVVPLDATLTRFSSTMQPVNENPTHFGLFPEADRATNWTGHLVQSGPQSYQGTFVSYLTRMTKPGAGAVPLAETVAILLLTTTLELNDSNTTWTGEATIAAYQASQDANQDGLPDDDQTPLDCSSFTCTAKRLGLTAPCQPKPPADTIEVIVGEDFVIPLDSNPTTGYSWELASSLPKWLELIGSEYVPTPTEPGIVGSGGVEEWTFRANTEGTTTITFEYRRPWEKDQPPAERKTFVIVARSGGKRIEVTVGSEFTISLESNASTGYSWELTSTLPTWLELVSSEYIPGQAPPGWVGVPGVEKWTFRASGAGTTTLTFEYRQPWATGEPPAQQETLVVIARL
jgi:inhibitor of cysteine peptidase